MADDGIEEHGAAAQAMHVDAVTVGLPSFDLETYISAYTGRAKTKRLLFIASRCPDLRKDALLLCLEALRGASVLNMRELKDTVAALEGAGWMPPSSEPPAARIAAQAKEQERLETQVKSMRSTALKENVRVSLLELGGFLYETGDYEAALNALLRARDYYSQPLHLLEGVFSIARAALELERWDQVAMLGSRALGEKPQAGPASTLNALCGLAALVQGRYRIAANHFLDVNLSAPDAIRPYLSLRDIGLYVTLCALATFSRSELRERLVDNPNFKHALEHTPEFRDILRDFLASRPRAWRAVLARVRNDLLLDVHLHAHVEALFSLITEVAMVQFITPYITLDMGVLADAFALSLPDLEQKLAELALAGKLSIRIDSNAKVLHQSLANGRAATFAQAVQTGHQFELHCQGMLVRALMQRHRLLVTEPEVHGRGSQAASMY